MVGSRIRQEQDQSQEVDALSSDIERLSKYQELFDRSGFKVPCILEDSVVWLYEAIDQILEALGTGRVLDRDRQLLYTVPRKTEFETKQFILSLDQASRLLLFIRREIAGLTN